MAVTLLDNTQGQSESEITRKELSMAVAHTSRIQIAKHAGPHRTALIEGFDDPLNFGIHGGIRHFYQEKYGRKISGPEYPATLDHMIAGVGG